jgi:hypothetical protein
VLITNDRATQTNAQVGILMTLKKKRIEEVGQLYVVIQAKGYREMVGKANGELNHPNVMCFVLMIFAKRRQ